MADEVKKGNGWCGETHLQKATYFLQALLEVPMNYRFILYKHAPFAFDLRDELTALRADWLLQLQPEPYPFGASLVPTPTSVTFRQRYAKTVAEYQPLA